MKKLLLVVAFFTSLVCISQAQTTGYVLKNADGTVDLPANSVTKAQASLPNVDNTSDANKPVSMATQTALNLKANLASPTFTGTPVLPTAVTVSGNTITMPAVAGTLLINTTTSGVGASPTASSTVTITHGLGRVPTIIRIYGIGTFTSNAAATPTTMSVGTYNSTGNRALYQAYNTAAITTTQTSATSTAFAIALYTGANSFITGVIQNVTSTQFDIVWTETGTATAQNYLWEAQ